MFSFMHVYVLCFTLRGTFEVYYFLQSSNLFRNLISKHVSNPQQNNFSLRSRTTGSTSAEYTWLSCFSHCFNNSYTWHVILNLRNMHNMLKLRNNIQKRISKKKRKTMRLFHNNLFYLTANTVTSCNHNKTIPSVDKVMPIIQNMCYFQIFGNCWITYVSYVLKRALLWDDWKHQSVTMSKIWRHGWVS